MKKLFLFLPLLFLATLAFSQAPQDSIPPKPSKQEVRTQQPLPVNVIYKVSTSKGKLLDVSTASFASMAFYAPQEKQLATLFAELKYQLYTNNRLPKGFDKGRTRILILDIKRL